MLRVIRFYRIFIFVFSIYLFMPGNLPAQQVKLGWEFSENPNVVKYGIYRSEDPNGSFTQIGTADHPENTFTDTNVQLHIHYYYAATSIDNAGNESGFSNIVDTTITSTVPVELTTFSAQVQGHEVELQWKTATESNNLGFEVQKSINEADNFQRLAFINGNGTSTTPNQYQYVDQELKRGHYYYRLKQIDLDGSYEYSPTRKVSIALPNQFELSQNYPNPFNPETTIKYSLTQSGPVKLTIFASNGKIVNQIVNKYHQAGKYEVIWDGINAQNVPVSSGVYYYKIETGEGIKFRKMTLLK